MKFVVIYWKLLQIHFLMLYKKKTFWIQGMDAHKALKICCLGFEEFDKGMGMDDMNEWEQDKGSSSL